MNCLIPILSLLGALTLFVVTAWLDLSGYGAAIAKFRRAKRRKALENILGFSADKASDTTEIVFQALGTVEIEIGKLKLANKDKHERLNEVEQQLRNLGKRK